MDRKKHEGVEEHEGMETDQAAGTPEDEEVDPRIEAGWRALESGDWDAAGAAAEDALTDESTRVDAMMLKAALAREAGHPEEALKILEVAARAEPTWCAPELWMAELLAEDPNRLGDALHHAGRALDRAEEEDEYLEALGHKGAIELEMGRPTDARKTLRDLPPADVSLGDPEIALDFAQLLMDVGDPAEAAVRLDLLTAEEPEMADAWYLSGLAAEIQGEEDKKRKAWLTTRALDVKAIGLPPSADSAGSRPERQEAQEDAQNGSPAPARLSEEALVAVAEATLSELPADLRRLMQNVPIVVADLPAAEDVAAGLDPRLLGMFSGDPHADSAAVLSTPVLTEIVLFRANIERVADDEETLHDEVRTTLLHEAGHFFGLDEAGLAKLGLE